MSRQNNIINKPEPAPGTLGKLDLFGIGFGAVVGAYEKIISNIQEDDLAVTQCTLRKIRQLMEEIK